MQRFVQLPVGSLLTYRHIRAKIYRARALTEMQRKRNRGGMALFSQFRYDYYQPQIRVILKFIRVIP